MEDENHVLDLGKLIANLQGLELTLRAHLSYTGKWPQDKPGVDLYSRKVGEKVPLTIVTSYHSLRDLINEFNAARPSGSPALPTELVDVRDALAHGRISAAEIGNALRLIKFSRPEPGATEVTITHNELMNTEWFKKQIRLALAAMKIVFDAAPAGAFQATGPLGES
jgi:hypothetical protein